MFACSCRAASKSTLYRADDGSVALDVLTEISSYLDFLKLTEQLTAPNSVAASVCKVVTTRGVNLLVPSSALSPVRGACR